MRASMLAQKNAPRGGAGRLGSRDSRLGKPTRRKLHYDSGRSWRPERKTCGISAENLQLLPQASGAAYCLRARGLFWRARHIAGACHRSDHPIVILQSRQRLRGEALQVIVLATLALGRKERNRLLMRVDLIGHVTPVESISAQFLQSLSLALIGTGWRCWQIETLRSCNRFQLIIGLGVIVDHSLRKFLDVGIV